MSMEANVRRQESQYDRGRTNDRLPGTRSAATLRKLPTEAPIKKANMPNIYTMVLRLRGEQGRR